MLMIPGRLFLSNMDVWEKEHLPGASLNSIHPHLLAPTQNPRHNMLLFDPMSHPLTQVTHLLTSSFASYVLAPS